ncbi:Uncharacterised protein [uncultured archaeon]|nr:Uncharacterised protein [uncultured archaeon]
MSASTLATDFIVAMAWGVGIWFIILNVVGGGQIAFNIGLTSFLILLIYFYTRN